LTCSPLPLHKLLEQNSALKAGLAIAEGELLARNERLQSLEALQKATQEELDGIKRHFEERTEVLSARLDKAKSESVRAAPSLVSNVLTSSTRRIDDSQRFSCFDSDVHPSQASQPSRGRKPAVPEEGTEPT